MLDIMVAVGAACSMAFAIVFGFFALLRFPGWAYLLFGSCGVVAFAGRMLGVW